MRARLKIAFAVLLALCLGRINARAQASASLPPPINVNVTQLQYSSPYGPRALAGKGYQFHQGVDYPYVVGTPIYAVQGGTIDKLNYEGAAGWLISIIGGANDPFPGQRFAYLHLFDDSFLAAGPLGGPLAADNEGNDIFAQATVNVGGGTSYFVTLEGLSNVPVGPSACLAIIFWKISAQNQPTFPDTPIVGFSPCPGLPIGNPMLGVVTQNTVMQGTIIAPVGQSGAAATAGAHLHLQVNSGDQNELLYVQHDHSAAPPYTISIFKDQGDPTDPVAMDANKVQLNNGSVLDPVQDSPLIIRAEVNYHAVGHDLDEVQMLMYQQGTPQPDLINLDKAAVTCLLSGLCKEFDYGGTGMGRSVSTLHCSTQSPCNVIQQSVYPQLSQGPTASGCAPNCSGVVDFLSDPIDLTTLTPGNYVILIRAFNIAGQFTEQSIIVTISGSTFSISSVSCIGPLSTFPGPFGDLLTFQEHISGPVPPALVLLPPTVTVPAMPSDFAKLVPSSASSNASSNLRLCNFSVSQCAPFGPIDVLCGYDPIFNPHGYFANNPQAGGNECVVFQPQNTLDLYFRAIVITPVGSPSGRLCSDGTVCSGALPVGGVTISAPGPQLSVQPPPVTVSVSCP